MFILNLNFMVLVCIYTFIGKKRNVGKRIAGISWIWKACVRPDQQCDVSVYVLNIAGMAITCQSAGDNDDFRLAFITSGKH